MSTDNMKIDCAELRAIAEESPIEMEVVVEMMIEAEVDLCEEEEEAA